MSSSAVSLPMTTASHYNIGIHDTTTRTSASGYDTTTSYEQSRRQVSSVVVSEQVIGELPESGGIKYVEVPVIEEVVKHVPRREIIEVEKIVPKYEYEWVERVVEVPQISYVDKTIEIPQIQEVLRHVPVKQTVEVPKEVIVSRPKIEVINVEKIVEVPGQVVEVPKPYIVEHKVPVKRWNDKNIPIVVAQTIRPVITESSEVIDVDVFEYEPQIIPVDVHVAKPVASHLVAVGATQEIHQLVTVPAAQYNTILRNINSHLSADMDQLPYIREGAGIPFLGSQETPGIVTPPTDATLHSTIPTDTALVSGVASADIQRDGVTTTSSVYHAPNGYYTQEHVQATTGSVVMGENLDTASQMTVPPVYPNVVMREIESVAPSVGKTQSHYATNKSHKSHRTILSASQPAQHRRRACQC